MEGLATDDENPEVREVSEDRRLQLWGGIGQIEVHKTYAANKRMLVHTAYPGGPSRVVVEREWYRDMGKCPVAETTLVMRDKNHHFSLSTRFMFLKTAFDALLPIGLSILCTAWSRKICNASGSMSSIATKTSFKIRTLSTFRMAWCVGFV